MRLFRMLLEKFCRDLTAEDVRNILYVFFPFMFGLYPYAAVTEKQRGAMQKAGVDYEYSSVQDLAFRCLVRLLRADEKEDGSWIM